MSEMTSAAPPTPSGDPLTAGMLEALRKTKPWVRFLSVLGFLMVALMVLAGLGIALFSATGKVPGFTGGTGVLVGLLYIVLSVFYVFPSLFLSRYASAIGEAIDSPIKAPSVENALRQQKSFWKFVGVFTAVMIVVYILALLVMFVVTVLQR